MTVDTPTSRENTEPEKPRNVVFAAPADDPRARRPADVYKLVIYLLIVLLSGWAYATPSELDERVADFFAGDLPGWISGTFTIIFIVGGLYALGLLLAILFFGRGRRAIARDMLAAVVLAIASAIGMAALTGPELVDFFPEVLERDGVPSFPVARLTFAVAMVSVARPYLALPMRRVGSRLVAAMAVSAVVMTYGAVSATIGALALGAAAAAGVHLIFGSGVGIPSKARIGDDLHSIGLDVVELDYLEDQPIGATLLEGRSADGTDVFIKVYGRDAADAATASRVWRSMWYKDHDRALTATGLQQVEHEGLMLLQARSAEASVPELLGLGRGPNGDALLVTALPDGTPLAHLDDAVDEATLDGCWDAVNRLHDARLVHGSLDLKRIVAKDGQVVLRDLSGAALASDSDARARDIAQMLVVTTLVAGADRAVAAARRGVGDDVLLEALPLIQANALSTTLQHEAKEGGLKLKELRATAAEALGAESPDPVQLERVTWGNVAMLGLTLFAAYALISSLSDIGFDTIVEEIGDAEWAWIVIALILAQMTNIGEYFSLTGVVKSHVPFGPTLMFRYALSFIELAVPGDAGAIAMNIRYMRKLGESTAAAVAQGPLLTVFSKGFDIILLLIASRIIGQTIDLDDVDTGALFNLLLLVLFAIVIGVVVVLVVPKLRARLLPHFKEGFGAMRGSITNPERLLRVAGGTLFQKMLFAMTLSASVAAYGETLGFAEALFVNSAVSLFVGLIPVPGGVGVGEAAITAGLVAVGIPEEQAVAAAITHRMVTAYLPPVFGWYASRWLGDRDYL